MKNNLFLNKNVNLPVIVCLHLIVMNYNNNNVKILVYQIGLIDVT